MGTHKSRLEKEKEAAAAARRATGASPPVSGKLPSYMRPTSASKAMQKVCVIWTALESVSPLHNLQTLLFCFVDGTRGRFGR